MVKFCVLLILLAAINFEVNGNIQSKDPSENKDLGSNDNEVQGLSISKRGWSKPKPCGRPGKPPCPTEGTTLPTTLKPSTTTSGNGIITPSNDEEVTTTRRPKPSTDNSRPTWGTTSSADVTETTTKQTTTTTSRRPKPTPPHEGGMVFPDDDDDHPITSKPNPDVVPDKDTETTTATTSTTQSSSTQECIRKCPVTPEYNPVCGSDGVTYSNPGRLSCAQHCGVKVTLRSRGPCSTTTTSTTSTTTVTTTTQSSAIKECIRKCPVTPEYNPVCGSDGITYTNPGRLSCAQYCGVKVTLRSRGPCSTTTATTPVTTTVTSDPMRPTPSSAVKECIRKCPVTSEYNPMCGSDGVTYNNLGHLNCAYNCGHRITVVSLGACRDTGTTTSSTITTTGATQSPAIKQCIRNCPVTSEYNPVCGSDGVTYTNPGRLICARDCGVNVEQRARGPCSTISTTAAPTPTTESAAMRNCQRSCLVTPEYNPVCGSNGVTYNNLSLLQCAQDCKVDVKLKRQGRCNTSRGL